MKKTIALFALFLTLSASAWAQAAATVHVNVTSVVDNCCTTAPTIDDLQYCGLFMYDKLTYETVGIGYFNADLSTITFWPTVIQASPYRTGRDTWFLPECEEGSRMAGHGSIILSPFQVVLWPNATYYGTAEVRWRTQP